MTLLTCSFAYRLLEQEFLAVYETLAPMVVPRSAKFVVEDDEYKLYSVIVFKKTANEFKAKSKEAK